ncbi:hypothetical protein [Gayadomonas joobiniege]|uniref:hypothetical protein n=1 Tax=Gayadomonas joobiniege TaxID=1234606 RepID=UPI00036DB653|nr:hypothetical protein [Gayadomonas joobiniege]
MSGKKLLGTGLVGIPFVALLGYISQVGGSNSLILAISLIGIIGMTLFGGLLLAEKD